MVYVFTKSLVKQGLIKLPEKIMKSQAGNKDMKPALDMHSNLFILLAKLDSFPSTFKKFFSKIFLAEKQTMLPIDKPAFVGVKWSICIVP